MKAGKCMVYRVLRRFALCFDVFKLLLALTLVTLLDGKNTRASYHRLSVSSYYVMGSLTCIVTCIIVTLWLQYREISCA